MPTYSDEALSALRDAVKASKRKTTVQLPVSFARLPPEEGPPPLARMIRGGQGDEVRLKLYLTLLMLAAKPPRTIRPRSTRYYASVLRLEGDRGERRVRAAQRWLTENNFICYEKINGHSPKMEVLHPDGSGLEYPLENGPRFIGPPLQLWQSGELLRLTAPALAVYIAILELTGGREAAWGTGDRKQEYALSETTWTKVAAELVERELIKTRVVLDSDEDRDRRQRVKYEVARLDPLNILLAQITDNVCYVR